MAALLALLLIAPAAAQPDKPTIGILRFGFYPTFHWMEGALLDMLELHGWLSAEERESLRDGVERIDRETEQLNIFWGDADYDLNNARLLIESALDREPDMLITLSTPLTQAAISETLDMDEPPPLFFAGVYNPQEAGIIEDRCDKPPHVTGVEVVIDYGRILPLLLLQHPDLQSLGTIYNSSEATGSHGARRIVEVAEGLGIEVAAAPVVGVADVQLAAESLLGKGVEAILVPYDLTLGQSINQIANIAWETETPVYHASLMSVYVGATAAVGPFLYYEQGRHLGRLAIAQLEGELDVAGTAVMAHANLGVAVSLDTAEALGIELSEALLEAVDVRIIDGETLMEPEWGRFTAESAQLLPVDEQRAVDAEILADLRCAD